MTRKRFVKLLMARGYDRNEANAMAWEVIEDGGSYERKYADIVAGSYLLDEILDFVASISSAFNAFAAALPNLVRQSRRIVDAWTKTTAPSYRALLAEHLRDRQT